MQKLSNWIVNNKKWIISITIILIALSVIGAFFVQKNGDVISYLDKNTDTIKGKELLDSQFGIVADLNIAISYVPESLVSSIASYANRNSYVQKVVWKGTFDDLSLLESIDPTLDKDNIALTQQKAKEKFVHTDELGTTYFVSIYFKTAGSDNITIQQIDKFQNRLTTDIQKLIDSDYKNLEQQLGNAQDYFYIGGTAQNARALVKSSLGDMPKFIIIAIVICFIILLLTTKSYLEPLIFLATLGISILFNMGSNIIAGNPIGTISTITSSCAIILQLALSMDYSIFLMHTYYEEKALTLDSKQALRKALPKTIIAISSSALTTVGGFVALFFMQFGMGYDLGFVLAKGVLFSLLAVIFIQPILIMTLDKLIESTKHEWRVDIRLSTVGKVATKKSFGIVVIILCVCVAIPCAYFQTKVPLNYITMNRVNPTPTQAETLANKSYNQVIVLVPYDKNNLYNYYTFVDNLNSINSNSVQEYLTYDNGSFVLDSQENKVKPSQINSTTEVFGLFTIVSQEFFEQIEQSNSKNLIYSRLHSSFISNINGGDDQVKYCLFTVNIDGSPESEQSYKTIDVIRRLGNDTFGDGQPVVQLTGLTVGANDLKNVTPRDFTIVNIVSASLIFIILLFTFRKVFLSLILLFVIEIGIFVNLTLVLLLAPTGLFDSQINFISYIIVSAIELGATVDYAIMLTSKYLEEKKNGTAGEIAVKNAIYRSAPTILTSGSILIIICLAIRLVTSNMIVGQITELLARGAMLSVLLVFTLLPAILSLMERTKRSYSLRKKGLDIDQNKNTQCLYDLQPKKVKKVKRQNNKKAI